MERGEMALTLEEIADRPIWQLLPEEIDRLTEREQAWIRNRLHEMKENGALAMLLANPPNTKYEVVWDHAWVLRPMKVDPDYEARLNAVEDCLRDICKTQMWYEAIKKTRYAQSATKASEAHPQDRP
jgi:hypothetical protein